MIVSLVLFAFVFFMVPSVPRAGCVTQNGFEILTIYSFYQGRHKSESLDV